MNTDVYLCDSFAERVEDFAKRWAERKGGSRLDRFWPQGAPSSNEAIRRGFYAEAGLCQWLGLDYAPQIHKGGDGGLDILFRGLSLQVKATTYPDGGLIFDSPDLFRAKLGVLVHLNVHNIREQAVLGWVTREGFRFYATEKRLNPDRPPKLFLPQNQLHAPLDLPGLTHWCDEDRCVQIVSVDRACPEHGAKLPV